MLIWLCKYGETLPIYPSDRKYRVGMIAEALHKYNHDVVWWASDFDHGKKSKIKLPEKTYLGIELKKISGRIYKKNISIDRLIHNYQIGKQFEKKSRLEKRNPDLIYTSMPTIDMAYRATRYAVVHKIKLVVDIRDLWPDVFRTLKLFRLFKQDFWFANMNRKLRYILNNADLIIAPTQAYLEWAKRKKEVKLKKTLVIPFGYQRPKLFDSEMAIGKRKRFEVTFAGTLGVNFDLETVLKAAEHLQEEQIFFNIVGSGDMEVTLKQKYGHLKNVTFWGWCDALQLHEILLKSSVGIAPYLSHDNFIYNIPNKPYEYIAYGLKVFTCLYGETWNMLKKDNLGVQYEEGNYMDLKYKLLQYKNNNNSEIEDFKRILRIFERKYSADIIYTELVREMEKLV